MPSAMKKSKAPVSSSAEAGKKNNKVPFKGTKKDKPMKAKEERPKKKLSKEADKAARMAIGSGDLAKDEVKRKKEQDSRTLYIRFGDKESLPTSAEEIKALHSDIKFVRTPRKAVKSTNDIRYAFLEFGSAEECKAARGRLATTQYKGKELIVDFVGEASKNKSQKGKVEDKAPSRLNPTRLFICGLAPGVSKTNLKEMFPKASHADIPANSKKKGTSYGFVQFSSPGDAKAAFDAAKGLSIGGHKITVLFAKITDKKPEVVQKKKEKREKKNAEKKLEKEEEDESKPKKAEKRKAVKEEEAAEEVATKKVKPEKAVKAETEALLATEEESDDEEDESEEDENDAAEDGEEDEDSDEDEVEGEGGDKDNEEEEDEDDENDDDDSEDEEEEGADQKSDVLIQEAEEDSDDDDDDDNDDDDDDDDDEEDE